jgi:hypothetical protein
MFRTHQHRSIAAALLLGGTLLASPLSWGSSWESLWASLFSWIGAQPGEAAFSESSSGIDPDGRPTSTTGDSADSDYSSGIDPNGRPTSTTGDSADSDSSSDIDPNGRPR